MKQFLRRFKKEEKGQSLIEYTLLLGALAIVSIGLYIGVGTQAKSVWTVTNNSFSQVTALDNAS